VLPLLREGDARRAHVYRLREAAGCLTWDRTAAAILGAYHDTLALADRDLARVHEQHIPDARYWGLRHAIGGTGLSLVGPENPLLTERAQRALAALAKRPLTRGPLLALLGLLSGAGGHGGTGTPPELPVAVDPQDPDEPDDDADDADVQTASDDAATAPVRVGSERRRAKFDP
jgi:hypothetical protein